MRRSILIRSALLALSLCLPGLSTVDIAHALRPKLPPAGDCKAMAAAGKSDIWYGEFSGQYESMANDRIYPVAARGCFTSERECRRWTNQLLSITASSGFMRCRPY